MPAEIDLSLNLPDGRVAVRHGFPMAQEVRQATDPSRQADEREWVLAELPEAIELLYLRAGFPTPADRVKALAATLPPEIEPTPENLTAVLGTFWSLRNVTHEVAAALGVDVEHRQVDSRTLVLAGVANLPRLAAQKAADAKARGERIEQITSAVRTLVEEFPVSVRKFFDDATPEVIVADAAKELRERAAETDRHGELFDAIKRALRVDTDSVGDDHLPQLIEQLADASPDDMLRRLSRLAGMFGFAKDFADMDEAVARDLERRRTDATKAAIGLYTQLRDSLTALYGLPKSDSDLVNEVFLDIAGARDKQLAEARRRGQLDVLEALDVDASQLPADAELTTWAARASRTWFDEARRPLETELSVTRSYLAGLLDKLDVGGPAQLEGVRAGTLSQPGLADLVGEADDKVDELGTLLPTAARLRDAANRLLEFFELPAATPDEKLADRVIKASTEAISNDAADLTTRANEATADLSVVLGTLGRIAEPYGILTPLEGAALREGRMRGETLKSVAGEIGRKMMDRYAEQTVMRSLAGEVAALAGANGDHREAVSNGSLSPQLLANLLREYKAILRKATPSAERDVYRRLLDDIAAKLGTDGRDTLLPGAVGDLVRNVEARDIILRGVRGVLAELRDGLDCADEDLPGLVRQTVLTEGYPIGTVVELENGELGMVVEISADAITSLPIVVRLANRQKLGVRVSEIRRIRHDLTALHEQARPGEFFTDDGRKAKAFKLPENGLAEILAQARLPKLPKLDPTVFDEGSAKVADLIEAWGERLAKRFHAASDRLATEIDEAVENATRKQDGGE